MNFGFNVLGYTITSVVLTLIFWYQLDTYCNENNSLIVNIIHLFFAIIASNWICSKLDNILDNTNNLNNNE